MAADLRLGIALVLLLGAAVGALHLAGVRIRRQVVVAAVRAAVQLAVIGVVLGVVFRYPGAAALVLLVMLTTATRTAARRLRDFTGAPRAVLLSSLAGALTTLVVAFGTGAVDFSVRYIVSLGGIVLGGTMTACTLAGRQLLGGIRSRREEVEGWLALGATSRQAVRDIARTAAGEALLPAIDQTRTVGRRRCRARSSGRCSAGRRRVGGPLPARGAALAAGGRSGGGGDADLAAGRAPAAAAGRGRPGRPVTLTRFAVCPVAGGVWSAGGCGRTGELGAGVGADRAGRAGLPRRRGAGVRRGRAVRRLRDAGRDRGRARRGGRKPGQRRRWPRCSPSWSSPRSSATPSATRSASTWARGS